MGLAHAHEQCWHAPQHAPQSQACPPAGYPADAGQPSLAQHRQCCIPLAVTMFHVANGIPLYRPQATANRVGQSRQTRPWCAASQHHTTRACTQASPSILNHLPQLSHFIIAERAQRLQHPALISNKHAGVNDSGLVCQEHRLGVQAHILPPLRVNF